MLYLSIGETASHSSYGTSGIGKTAIMEQAARECGVGLWPILLPTIPVRALSAFLILRQKCTRKKEVSVTEYTLSEIIASVYQCMKRPGKRGDPFY